MPLLIALSIMIAFLIAERALRKDAASRTLDRSDHDKGTALLVGVAFGVSVELCLHICC
jgi:hypothetical protein